MEAAISIVQQAVTLLKTSSIAADGNVVPSQAEQCAAGSDIFEDEQQGSSGLGEPLSSQTKSRLRFAASSDF